MVSKEYLHIGEEIYHVELSNDLHIYVDRRPESQKSYASSVVNHGDMDMKLRLNSQWRDTSVGVAHLLKHRMLDVKDGNTLQDPMANGVSPNTLTSSALTGYYFESTKGSCDNLKTLLSFMSIPWFTQESVDKEQGIIGQEIHMMEDDPDNQVFHGLMERLFDHRPVRVPVVGTQEPISRITANILYVCHKAFYTPSNMMLTVAGDVEPEEVVRIVREIPPKEPGGHIEQDYGGGEDGAAAKSEKELRIEVSIPIFQLDFKAEPTFAGEGRLCRRLIDEPACEALLGNSSPLYARLYGEGLINKNFGYGFKPYSGCSLMVVGDESRDPWAVWDAVLAGGACITRESVDEGLFRRLKKGVYGVKVRGLNSFENVCIELTQAHFAGAEYLTFPEVLGGISKADVEDYIRRWVMPGRCGLAVVRSGEETW